MIFTTGCHLIICIHENRVGSLSHDGYAFNLSKQVFKKRVICLRAKYNTVGWKAGEGIWLTVLMVVAGEGPAGADDSRGMLN